MKKYIMLTLFGLSAYAQDPFAMRQPLPEAYTLLPVGAIRPEGWLREQMKQNLDGFTGHLDSLAHDLLVKDDIFGRDRLSRKVKSKDVGALGNEGDWQIQLLWWNSETQGNWRDGFIRSAILLGDKEKLSLAKAYVDRILATQDSDGYLGIYDPELRYHFDNENGELWAKATLLRGLLAWYEYSKDPKVLKAVRRAVDNAMEGFPVGSHPFYSRNENVGGTSHGLTFTDVLESLYHHTKDRKYRDYALFLYKDFSLQKLNEDGQYAKLMDPALSLKGHGVHTYEQLRSLAAAAYASGSPDLINAMKRFEDKIGKATTVTGAPIGDEWILDGKADPERGYEYCSLQELMHSYESLFAKTGSTSYGDAIERIFFNAAQGARHPEGCGIAYLKTDNSFEMSGGRNGDNSDPKQTRYRYSPVHKEAAVCCVPNAGRIAPYYTQYMWMKKDEHTLVAALLGPSSVVTDLNGREVHITEKTEYPYGKTLTFAIESATDFVLLVRKPDWVMAKDPHDPRIRQPESPFWSYEVKKGKQEITIELHPKLDMQDASDGHGVAFTYGPLVLAYPIASTETVTKRYDIGNLRESNYIPRDRRMYFLPKDQDPDYREENGHFFVRLSDEHSNERQLELLPVGKTILRQTVFPYQP